MVSEKNNKTFNRKKSFSVLGSNPLTPLSTLKLVLLIFVTIIKHTFFFVISRFFTYNCADINQYINIFFFYSKASNNDSNK